MMKFVSIAALAAASLLTAACGNSAAKTDPAPRRVQVEVAEAPTVTETRCFMRVKIENGRVALVDFRKPIPDTILHSQQRNFETCVQARQGDVVVLDAGQVG